MALTQEQQVIFDAVIASLRTNSKTIEQLTPQTSLGSNDWFELNGGRKVSYTVLRDLIASMSSSDQDSLRTLIGKNVLKSVSFDVGESTATLTIKSAGTTISCNVPVATSAKAGIISALDKVKIQTAYDNGQTAISKANAAQDTANTARTEAAAAQSTANNANSAAATAQSTANAAKAVTDTKGQPGGIASLDSGGKVPASQLPGYVDDVVEFNAIVSGVTPQMSLISHKSTDPGCMVVYDADKNRFILAVSKRTIATNENWGTVLRPVKTLKSQNAGTITPQASVSGNLGSKYQLGELAGEFWQIEDTTGEAVIIVSQFNYYNNWLDADSFGETGTLDGRTPDSGKIYTCTSSNRTYRWSGSELVTIGSDLALGHTSSSAFPGDEGADLQTRVSNVEGNIEGINILPFDGVWDGTGTAPTTGIYYCPNDEDGAGFRCFGNSSYERYGWPEEKYNSDMTANPDAIYRCGTELFHIVDGKMMPLSGSAVGNTFNVTVEIPLPAGEYYSDIAAEAQTHNVLNAVFEHGVASVGLQITFAIGARTWKSYQYVGVNDTEGQFKNIDNWIDLAGMSAGSEAVINIDELVPRTVAGYYTKDTAIDALLSYIQSSSIDYSKGGLIITFRASEYGWETYQFTGQPSDMSSKALWVPFGGGGSVKTEDEPANGGKDAFSTGGAYDMAQAAFDHLELDQDSENYVIKAVSKSDKEMGDSIKLPKSTGSGQVGGTTLSIIPEESSVYAAFGSDIILRAAIRSVTYEGETEILNMIRRVEIIDTATGISLMSEAVNQNSSTSATNYSFTFDFTPYFTEAAARDFTIVAHDADGNVRRKTVTVTAVDVTVTCEQALNFTRSSLEVGGSIKTISLYKFPNNVSKQGVKAYTEIYIGGAWKSLGTAVITDNYTHSISINPNNVLGGGEKMTHGSYPIRFWGEDVASGVKGNTFYTAVMCVDPELEAPVVAMRFNDTNNGSIRLYDTLELEVAAYTPGKNSTSADVYIDGQKATTIECQIGQTYTVRKQINGYVADGTKKISCYAMSLLGSTGVQTKPIEVTVKGSAIDAAIKSGALFGYDFATRSNDETDHTITDNGYELEVIGSNWSSNGFRPYLGETALRIAENVKAHLAYAPFTLSATERTNGMALQFAFATNNVKDSEAKLMECYDPDSGAGFYICGNKIVVTCKTGSPGVITKPFRWGEKHSVGIVVEPFTISHKRGSTDYSNLKLYMDGEEIGTIGYVSNSGAILNQKEIDFNGTDADFYLYYMLVYDTYYEWKQAFDNYLCKLTDTDAMIAEYEAEDVLDNQNRPSMAKFKEKGIPYYVVVASQATFDSFDSDINTSTKFNCTLFYFDPVRPWRSFKAVNVQWRRQGTTSAKRPIKNDRFYLRKPVDKKNPTVITALNPDYTNADALKTYELFEQCYVRVGENTIPVAIITVKVDYSDSSMANDCGVCDMMNATFRALGSEYITPAQRSFDGTWTANSVTVTGLQMNHSTANHPIAAFRSTNESLTDAWFHARGNWKEDKGEQVALGFKDTPGYNKGCKNYGDFVEFFGKATFDGNGHFVKQETLAEIVSRFKTTEGLDTSKLYLLSQYCGRDYLFMRYSGGEWAVAPGSMKQVNGQWVISGDVLNPVSGYELITYDGMDWFMGVGSIDDMMAPTETASSWVSKLSLGQPTYPAWTQYFECMIDDDQLQEDLAMGRKVPYDLYNVLKFCDSCDYSKEALADTWGNIWKQNAWKYMSIPSLLAYYTFTDYLAAVDQQAKNMQPMFFLEDGCSVTNGTYSSPSAMEPIRMYENKVYDCDTCNGKDNDGGNTIPADLNPEEDDKCYAGRGSILWNNLRRCSNQEMVCDANGNTLTLPGVVNKMRNLPEIEGVGAGPFSPQGALYYFVKNRIEVWPKVVCTYDCERKYIKYSELYNDIYFYALHGSGRQSLPAFIQQRWRVRDGYYQTGDFKDASHVLGGRIGAKTGAKITFKAAKDGYFGIGNDGGNVTQGMYLKAGETGVFTQFQHGDNVLLYIYQADQMSEIDLSEISLDPNFQFSQMRLAEKIVIGSLTHKTSWTLSPGNTGFLQQMNLGELPFLKHLDVRNTEITTINAEGCPRLEKVLASGSDLTTIRLAETSPLETLELPAGMTELNLVNLPKLSYPGGLTIASMANVNRLMLAGCPDIDPMSLINGIVSASNIRYLRLPNVNIIAPSATLSALRTSGAIGLDPTGQAYDETNKCSGVTGRWIFTDLVTDAQLAAFKAYFPALNIYNSQYSTICYSDVEPDTENISNMDDSTGYRFNNTYTVPAHWQLMVQRSHAMKTTFNAVDGKMHCTPISDSSYSQLADGSSYDPSDMAGEGFDVMKHVPKHHYKGINDYKNQLKYTCFSMLATEPLSTCALNADGTLRRIRKKLSQILVKELSAIITTDVVAGGTYALTDNPNMNVYAIDVDGMKQVRWPGLNNAQIGAVFLNEDGKVISKYNMSVSNSLFDFTLGDYIFIDVPKGAKKFVFTSPRGFDDQEAIAVDSTAIEAIEPDWVVADEYLIGVYGGTLDALMRIRSISGAVTRRGDNNHSTNSEWSYDNDAELTNTTVPTSTMHYSSADLINLCRMRGKGYQGEDGDMNDDLAQIIYGIVGDRDIQAKCGYGCTDGYTTGASGANDLGNVTRFGTSTGQLGNILFGLQNYIACMYEAMDYVGINISDYISWRKGKYSDSDAQHTIDAKWHFYNPVTKTERVVQGLNQSDLCIARTRHGRFCSMVAARMTSNSQWNQFFADAQYYTHNRGRLPRRAGFYASAYYGLAFVYASYAASYAYSFNGVRLAFRGAIVIETSEVETA